MNPVTCSRAIKNIWTLHISCCRASYAELPFLVASVSLKLSFVFCNKNNQGFFPLQNGESILLFLFFFSSCSCETLRELVHTFSVSVLQACCPTTNPNSPRATSQRIPGPNSTGTVFPAQTLFLSVVHQSAAAPPSLPAVTFNATHLRFVADT